MTTSAPAGRFIPWVLVVALTLLAAGAAVGSAFNAPAQASGNPVIRGFQSNAGFAGYQAIEPVTTISADFKIPTVLPGSAEGVASTWIGASSNLSAFIQVGAVEAAHSSSGHGGGAIDRYEAFWSDTRLDFAPHPLGILESGDEVSVQMSQTGEGWLLRLRDKTSGFVTSFQSHYGAGLRFDISSWMQEDPISRLKPFENLQYPQLAATNFSKLEVNGTVPTLRLNNAVAMFVSGGPILVPAPVKDDGFSVVPPTGYAKQYLIDVAPYNLSLVIYLYSLDMPQVSNLDRLAAARGLLHALKVLDDQVSSQMWPTAVDDDLAAFLRLNGEYADVLRASIDAGHPIPRDLGKTFKGGSPSELSAIIRAKLGIPPINL
jgi:hypothetical protein